MSGHQVSRSNPYSCLSHPNNVSFPARTPGWTQCPRLNGVNSLKRPRIPNGNGSEFSSYRGHLEQPFNPSSPRLPLQRICMGRPYNSKCVETSHLANNPKVARKPACHGSPHCLLCTDRPSDPSSPTFLDHIIKGINYLDRSASAFCNNYPKTSLSAPRRTANYLERATNSLNLDNLYPCRPHSYSIPRANMATSDKPAPRRTANYLERATNSLNLDNLDPCRPHSYSIPRANMATSDKPTNSTCMVTSTRGASALECLDDPTITSCLRRPQCRNLNPTLPQRPGVKLPEIPLFGNGLFSLGSLPKFWEAIRSGWRAPEPNSKPSSWW
ncbi:PREDICTED: uncharacterized protein LOC103609552 [Galeopterus variegatus]|uniref:Uncharacterized protein LOC103609552 n=1 Tax=Galeopterus variegatus TaxID=482537 RepID=A0ABM0SGT9_GALVR|nr:PREDICTED: uncharacterized protein LOC103609552 [Galeopterus variegatus]